MKNLLLMIVVGIVIVGAGVLILRNEKPQAVPPVVDNPIMNSPPSASAQEITLSMRNGNYYPQTITVKAGQPVRLTLDSSVKGCFRTFTIRDLNVYQNSASPGQTIGFTPAQKGSFRFACSMGMGYGTLVVE